jgi:hypothetical protein
MPRGSKIDCPLIDYVIPTISWSVTIIDAGAAPGDVDA